jgi:methionyl aminopeptidase
MAGYSNSMSYLKKPEDLKNLEYSCLVVVSFLELVNKNLRAGQDCGEWNAFVEDFFKFYKVVPSFKNHMGYKYSVCISINDEIVHGTAPFGKFIPNDCVVTFDCGCIYEGMYSDTAKTIIVGTVDPEVYKALEICKQSLQAAIEVCKSGVKVRDISRAIDNIVGPSGFGNVIDLGGHGVGYEVWADPYISHKPIAHHDQKKSLFTNKMICIEPMLTLGSHMVKEDKDGWTIRTIDGSMAVHQEHELIITKDGCKILTDIPEDRWLALPEELKVKYPNLF